MSRIEDEEEDPSERKRMEAAGEFRRQHRQRKEDFSNPSAYTADTYDKNPKEQEEIKRGTQQDRLDGDHPHEFGKKR